MSELRGNGGGEEGDPLRSSEVVEEGRQVIYI